MLYNPPSVDEQSPPRIHRQSELFRLAESAGLGFSDELEQFGWNLEDLVYEKQDGREWSGPRALTLNDLKRRKNNIPFVSFFSGCGGMDIGFEAVGFQHVAGFEINPVFCKTLRQNRPNWKVYGPPTSSGDVSDFEGTVEILSSLISEQFEGVFVGGPPCQPFSIASNQRFSKTDENFKRIGFRHRGNGELLFDYLALIKYFQPECFVLENVVGLRDIDDGLQLNLMIEELTKIGYKIGEPRVLEAADYGVPQFRKRLFVVGSRADNQFEFPVPETFRIGSGVALDGASQLTLNNETRNHKLSSIKRYIKLDYGQREPLGRVDRLDPCQPAKTVIAGGNAGGGRSHLHPEVPRTLTVRESARLQSFPDDFEFVGNIGRQFTQVGNAVPPVLAARIGIAISESIFGY